MTKTTSDEFDAAGAAARVREKRRVRRAPAVLENIVRILDGEVWTPDTLDQIGAILIEEGYAIRGPDDLCNAESVEGYRCTLDAGHTGDHSALKHPMHPYWRTSI